MSPKKFNYCLSRIRNGDMDGLKEIYYEYYEKMKFSARLRINDQASAEDIASNLLKDILEKIKEIKRIENPNAWIYTAVRNKAVDYIRENKKTINIENYNETTSSMPDDYDLRQALLHSLKRLTETEKEIFTEHFIYGFKYKEISFMHNNMPEGTIKSHVYNIKRKLKHLI